MKKIIACGIISTILLNNNIVFANQNNNTVKISIGNKIANVNGEYIKLSLAPYIQKSSESTMIPLRFVSTALGVHNDNINFNPNNKEITIIYNGKVIKFISGTNKMYLNGKEVILLTDKNVPIYTEIKDGTTFIPLKALSIGLGINIEWEANTKSIIITNRKLENNNLNNGIDDVNTIFSKITNSSRERGTKEEINIANYIKSQLDTIGYETEIFPFPVYKNNLKNHNLEFFNINPFNEKPLLTAHNIIAEKNFDPNKKTIVISAHYDTTENNKGYLDNGSGTTALLELAKLLEPLIKNLDYNIRFIFFSSEEYYLTGSKSYLLSLNEDELKNIMGCINIDMISSKKWRKLFISGEKSKLTDEFLKTNSNFTLEDITNSDDISFDNKGIMSFTFSTVDTRNKDFDYSILKKEKNNTVDLSLLKQDINTLFNFIKNLDIKNLN